MQYTFAFVKARDPYKIAIKAIDSVDGDEYSLTIAAFQTAAGTKEEILSDAEILRNCKLYQPHFTVVSNKHPDSQRPPKYFVAGV